MNLGIGVIHIPDFKTIPLPKTAMALLGHTQAATDKIGDRIQAAMNKTPQRGKVISKKSR